MSTERSATPYTVAYFLITLLLIAWGAPLPLVLAACWWSGSNFGWQLRRSTERRR